MKKAIIIAELAALAVLASLALAGCSNELKSGSVYTTCIRGYMFAVFSGYKSESIAQIWEDGPDGPRPMECREAGR